MSRLISWLLCNGQCYSSAVDVKAGVTASGSSKFSVALKHFLFTENQSAMVVDESSRSVTKSHRSSALSGNSNFSWLSNTFRPRAHSCTSLQSSKQLHQPAQPQSGQPSQLVPVRNQPSDSLHSVSDLSPRLPPAGSAGRILAHHSAPGGSHSPSACGSALTGCYTDRTSASFSAAHTPLRCNVKELREHLRSSVSNDGSIDARAASKPRDDASRHHHPVHRQTLPGCKSGSRLSALLLNDASILSPTRSHSSFDSTNAASPSALRQQRQQRQLRQLRLIQNITLSRGSGASGAEAGTGEYVPRTPVQRSLSSNTPSAFCIAVQPTSPSNGHSKVIARRQTFHLHPSSHLPKLPTIITTAAPRTSSHTQNRQFSKSHSGLSSQLDMTSGLHPDDASVTMISEGGCELTPKHGPRRRTSVELLRHKHQDHMPRNHSDSSFSSCQSPHMCPDLDPLPPQPLDLEANIHRFFERCESVNSDTHVDSLSYSHPFSSGTNTNTNPAAASDCGLPSGQSVLLTSYDGGLAAKPAPLLSNTPRSMSLLKRTQFMSAGSNGTTFDCSDPNSVLHTLHSKQTLLRQSSTLSPDTPRTGRPHAVSCGADLLQQQDLQSWLQTQQVAPGPSTSGKWAQDVGPPSLLACLHTSQRNLWSLGEQGESRELPALMEVGRDRVV